MFPLKANEKTVAWLRRRTMHPYFTYWTKAARWGILLELELPFGFRVVSRRARFVYIRPQRRETRFGFPCFRVVVIRSSKELFLVGGY